MRGSQRRDARPCGRVPQELASGRTFKAKIPGLFEESFYVERKDGMLFLIDSIGAIKESKPIVSR